MGKRDQAALLQRFVGMAHAAWAWPDSHREGDERQLRARMQRMLTETEAILSDYVERHAHDTLRDFAGWDRSDGTWVETERAAELADAEWPEQFPAGLAAELFHKFSRRLVTARNRDSSVVYVTYFDGTRRAPPPPSPAAAALP